jgi:hypothetical protein
MVCGVCRFDVCCVDLRAPRSLDEGRVIVGMNIECSLGDRVLTCPLRRAFVSSQPLVEVTADLLVDLGFLNPNLTLTVDGDYDSKNQVLRVAGDLSPWEAPFGLEWIRLDDLDVLCEMSRFRTSITMDTDAVLSIPGTNARQFSVLLALVNGNLAMSGSGLQLESLTSLLWELISPDLPDIDALFPTSESSRKQVCFPLVCVCVCVCVCASCVELVFSAAVLMRSRVLLFHLLVPSQCSLCCQSALPLVSESTPRVAGLLSVPLRWLPPRLLHLSLFTGCFFFSFSSALPSTPHLIIACTLFVSPLSVCAHTVLSHTYRTPHTHTHTHTHTHFTHTIRMYAPSRL